MALWFAAIFAPVQIVIGDLHGLGVLQVAADEARGDRGNWERAGQHAARALRLARRGRRRRTDYEIAIPTLGSYILTHDFSGVVPGLKDVPPDQRPPVWPVFFSFRIMVGDRLRDARLGALEPLAALARRRCSPTAGSCTPPC